MPLDRIRDSYEKESPELTLARLRVQLDIILANEKHVLKTRRGFEKMAAAVDFDAMLKRGEELTPGQRSYIEGIYESMWNGASYDSINVHHDKPKGQLRYPR